MSQNIEIDFATYTQLADSINMLAPEAFYPTATMACNNGMQLAGNLQQGDNGGLFGQGNRGKVSQDNAGKFGTGFHCLFRYEFTSRNSQPWPRPWQPQADLQQSQSDGFPQRSQYSRGTGGPLRQLSCPSQWPNVPSAHKCRPVSPNGSHASACTSNVDPQWFAWP